MKNVKCISFVLIAALTSTLLPVSLVQAKAVENKNPRQSQIVDKQQKHPLSQTLINKATPFIKTTQSEFFLSKEGYSSLNSTEIKIVLDSIDASNTALKNASKTTTLNKTGNTFVQIQNGIQKSLIGGVNKAVFHWWGIEIYVNSNNVRLCAVGATGAGGAAIAAIPGIGWTIAGGVAGAIAATVAGDHKYPALIVSYRVIGKSFSVRHQ